MRLYKAVILVNLALALGVLSGSLWWQSEVHRLRRELAAARLTSAPRPEPGRSWTLKGIVRGVLAEEGLVVMTHEPVPGVMGAMTMGFRVSQPSLMRGLEAGDHVEFTLVATDTGLIVVALAKDSKP
jgi:Cu/Ag efflux protein CusF